jgi:hypothetical protein
MGTAPDVVKRLVDRFDQDRKVFLSPDNQGATRDWGLGTGDPNPNPESLASNPCAANGWDIGSLCYPDCPYEFSVLPADILGLPVRGRTQTGQVYEQFLGKVIRLTPSHQARHLERVNQDARCGRPQSSRALAVA